jgi:hypothetical protein
MESFTEETLYEEKLKVSDGTVFIKIMKTGRWKSIVIHCGENPVSGLFIGFCKSDMRRVIKELECALKAMEEMEERGEL